VVPRLRGAAHRSPGLTFVGWGEPIGCGGVAVFPNDIIVADQDGAVVIPQAFLDLILAEGAEQERMEGLDRRAGELRRGIAWSLSHECRDQGALRGFEEIVGDGRCGSACRNQGGHYGYPSRRFAADPPGAERRYFTGTVLAGSDHRNRGAGASLPRTRVSFEPGARTNWHTHPLGQTLYVISGVGRVQTRGEPVREIRPGDVVWIPPGEKAVAWRLANQRHDPTSRCRKSLDGSYVTWMEPVTDAEFRAKVGG